MPILLSFTCATWCILQHLYHPGCTPAPLACCSYATCTYLHMRSQAQSHTPTVRGWYWPVEQCSQARRRNAPQPSPSNHDPRQITSHLCIQISWLPHTGTHVSLDMASFVVLTSPRPIAWTPLHNYRATGSPRQQDLPCETPSQ